MPFSQMISFPGELSLRTTPDGLRVFRRPIKEIDLLHLSTDTWSNRKLGKDQTLPLQPSGQLFHILAEVEIPEGPTRLTFNLRGIPVVLTSKTLESGHKPASVQSQVRTVEFLVDRTSVESFVNDGEISSTRYALPKASGISVKAEGGPATIKSLTVHQLNSAWEGKAFKK
jgi:levanase/fructan beta-fructosidase